MAQLEAGRALSGSPALAGTASTTFTRSASAGTAGPDPEAVHREGVTKFHREEPKTPCSAYQKYMHERRATMQGSIAEVAQAVMKLWTEMDPEERQGREEKAKQEMEQYKEDRRKYDRCVRTFLIGCMHEQP